MSGEDLIIDFTDAKGYEPYTGDGAAVLLPFDGLVRAKIVKFKTGTSKTSGNKTVKLVLAVAEEGLSGTLYNDIPITGTNSKGEPNSRKFFDLLISAGYQDVNQLHANANQGLKKSVSEILNDLINKGSVVIADVKAETYQGNTTSKVNGFATPQRFEEATKAGTARRTRAGTTASSVVSNGGGASTAAATSALDMLS